MKNLFLNKIPIDINQTDFLKVQINGYNTSPSHQKLLENIIQLQNMFSK